MMGIEASLKKLSIQLGQVMEANGQQDRGKAPMHEQAHTIISSRSGYTIKEQDLRSFELSITVGSSSEEKAMLDLGAIINMIPYSVYERLGLRSLKPMFICLRLAD